MTTSEVPTTPQSSSARTLRAALWLCLAAQGAVSAAPRQAGDEGLAAAVERARELELRAPLRYHVEAWRLLAATRDPEAIDGLCARYMRPKQPKEPYRYLVAAAAAKGVDETNVTACDAWRLAAAEPEDAWLWFSLLAARAEQQDVEPLLEIARANESPYLRAAAIEALGVARAPELIELLPELVATLPGRPLERALLLGACGTALSGTATREARTERPWQRMALAMIALLDDEALPRNARLGLARHLGRALEVERLSLESAYWRAALSGEAREQKERDGKLRGVDAPQYVKPSLFGLEATGERIVYVVDLSDSMLEPVHGLGQRPTAPASGPKPKGEKGALPTEADIPWHLVKTRFDLAREHIKVSLRRLGDDQSFAIITFGTRAELLDGMTGLTRATPGNVKKAAAALDGIRVGGAQPGKPHGVLQGNTNLHGGLRLAFRLRERGAVDGLEHVELSGFESGCDTIFVLSDGDPSSDDYEVEDADYGDVDIVNDTETREKRERTDRVRYNGPYADWENLLQDVRRMNMFREVELHCVSLGNTQASWLKKLAELGFGGVSRP